MIFVQPCAFLNGVVFGDGNWLLIGALLKLDIEEVLGTGVSRGQQVLSRLGVW